MNKHLLRLLAMTALALVTNISIAQTARSFVGSWKVVGFGDAEMNIDLQKGTAEGENVPAMDSTLSKALFQAMNASIGNMIYSFDKNGKYKLIRNNEVNEEGHYKVDNKKNLLTLTTTRNNQNVADEYIYVLKKNKLVLKDNDEYDPMVLTLEKQN